jgi:hypothetical protein
MNITGIVEVARWAATAAVGVTATKTSGLSATSSAAMSRRPNRFDRFVAHPGHVLEPTYSAI